MKIFEKTVERLNKYCDDSRMAAIGEILFKGNLIGKDDSYFTFEENFCENYQIQQSIRKDGKKEYVFGKASSEYYKRFLNGLHSKYPELVLVSFTLGLNGVELYEVNKLVRCIENDIIENGIM